jgi:hypothetical protein
MASQQAAGGMDTVTLADFISYFSAHSDDGPPSSSAARKQSMLDLPAVCKARNAACDEGSPQTSGLDLLPPGKPAFEVGSLVQLEHHAIEAGRLRKQTGSTVLLIVHSVERCKTDGGTADHIESSYILKIPGQSGEGFRFGGTDVGNLSHFTQYASEGSDTDAQGPPSVKEPNAGEDEKEASAGEDEKETNAGEGEKEANAGEGEKEANAGEDEKETNAGEDANSQSMFATTTQEVKATTSQADGNETGIAPGNISLPLPREALPSQQERMGEEMHSPWPRPEALPTLQCRADTVQWAHVNQDEIPVSSNCVNLLAFLSYTYCRRLYLWRMILMGMSCHFVYLRLHI